MKIVIEMRIWSINGSCWGITQIWENKNKDEDGSLRPLIIPSHIDNTFTMRTLFYEEWKPFTSRMYLNE